MCLNVFRACACSTSMEVSHAVRCVLLQSLSFQGHHDGDPASMALLWRALPRKRSDYAESKHYERLQSAMSKRNLPVWQYF